MQPEISVIIPTLATSERAPFLRRAVEMVQAQQKVRARALVIANGPRVDPGLLAALEARPGVRVVRSEADGLANALRVGVAQVDTPWFSELDDDDEMPADALQRRLELLEADPRLDAVIGNAILRGRGPDRESIPDVAAVSADPLRALLQQNWLVPGCALFRTERVGLESFAGVRDVLEWTYLGAVLALRHRLGFLAAPTLVHYYDRPFSVDRSNAYEFGRPAALARLLALELPAWARRRVREKLAAEHHAVSVLHLAAGRRGAAWLSHLQSLRQVRGWRYLAYTRHLLRPGAWGGAGE